MKPRFSTPGFLIGFCVAYAVVFARNLPLFFYYPQTGAFGWGPVAAKGVGPGMAWYGLVAGATLVALVVAFITPRRVEQALSGYIWLFPLALMALSTFLLRVFFV
jgi:hypothetical protein